MTYSFRFYSRISTGRPSVPASVVLSATRFSAGRGGLSTTVWPSFLRLAKLFMVGGRIHERITRIIAPPPGRFNRVSRFSERGVPGRPGRPCCRLVAQEPERERRSSREAVDRLCQGFSVTISLSTKNSTRPPQAASSTDQMANHPLQSSETAPNLPFLRKPATSRPIIGLRFNSD